jgi:integrase/DNA-directed RNA polymerase subunit RPC12/RpoP
MAEQEQIHCPQCGSVKNWKDGLRYTIGGDAVQRYVCRKCGYRFSETSLNSKPSGKVEKQNHVAVYWRDGPLALEAEIEKREAGAAKTLADVKGKLVDYAWWMKKEGYAENTITRRVRLLNTMVNKGASLLEPESVKELIAKQELWSPKTKELAVEAYSCFLRMFGGSWSPPRFMKVEKLPFIPTKEEIDQLIAACNKKVATFLQLLMETGVRCGEAWRLKWIDFDFDQGIVRVTPEKGGKPRIIKISQKLVAMLKGLPSYASCDKPFPGSLRHFARTYARNRAKAAFKLGNPRIKRISFHTFRHWKATMEYHRTKDILYVKELMGHRSIQSTLIYTQLVNFSQDEFTCKVAKSINEVKELVEAGFEYVCDYDGFKVFRKRK